MLRRVVAALAVLACAAGVVAYQATRPARAPASPRVFVPSPRFFQDFSPGFRTSIADLYYLQMVQYYGEHVSGDGRLDSLPEMTALVTAFALAPLLFEAEQPGTEVLHPVAVVIFSGLISSTLLDTFLTPAMFWLFGRKPAEALMDDKDAEAL